ncbi:zinc finger MYM-type protein 1 [Trichonephila clavipes]|nr:zinc finger MYM-type protein 1 [Trichonephila clavipes]
MEFYKGIKHGKTIDKDNKRLIKESQKYWYNLFERMIDIINYLASHNLSFRAHRESLKLNDSRHSGNFIDLFKLLSKYDLTLPEHMQCINENQLTQHYLSHDIQNKLIALMSKSVIEEIIHRVKQAKYHAFLLDCTRDVSHVEQMSIILRFCHSSTGAIEEHFVGFIAFAETMGEYITNSILQELERNDLNIQNCRGQGYDNGANMVGINKGVRTRILNINPRAFFTPCGCLSWNLLLIDAANSSATAKTFFGFINKIYVLFLKSSMRWDIVKTKLKLTLKPLSEKRWESRIAAVKAIFLQFDDVIECVNGLKN